MKFYNNIVQKLSFYSVHNYNLNNFISKKKLKIVTSYNSFSDYKNYNFIRLYELLYIMSNQRPFLKRIRFMYVRKKILKKFFLAVNVSSRNLYNFILYFTNFYLYFFNIYYQKKIKYNYVVGDNIKLYIDNLHFFFKNYPRLKFKSQIKILLISHN